MSLSFFDTDSIFENGIANQRDQSTKQNFTFFPRVHQCEFDQFFAFFCMTCQNIFRPVWRDDKNPRRIHWKDTILLKKHRHFFHIFHRSRTIESRLKKFNTNILLIQIYVVLCILVQRPSFVVRQIDLNLKTQFISHSVMMMMISLTKCFSYLYF